VAVADDDDDDDDLSDLSDHELHARVVKDFLAVFADEDFCVSIAPKVSCDEADTISAMLVLHGGREAARTWDDCHMDGDDDPEDRHHIPDIPDDASGAAEPPGAG
jgi:hypothetical protein